MFFKTGESKEKKPDDRWMQKEAKSTLKRLLPRLEEKFAHQCDEADWQDFLVRVNRHFPDIFPRLFHLYNHYYDFFYHVENIMATATRMWLDRPAELKALDAARIEDPYWYQSHRMVGATCYVDLFAGSIKGIYDRIPYLTELGVNYLHLMPLFKCPEGDNDGGYAVSSYRDVDPRLGTMEELSELASRLRHRGISLAVDFVFNHTSDEHDWARKALEGDQEFQEFYRMYDTREIPDQYEKTVREIFPDQHPGAFTYEPRIKKWVWTNFHSYQWDLNYSNPNVFSSMAEEMLFLANQGVDVLRLDAVAFLWKEMGTSCENLPEAHMIIQAFNLIARIAAPSLVFLSEAIVHPDDVIKYISKDECQLSYNPQLMALLWDALATREVRLLSRAMEKYFKVPDGCAWLNYVRSHDDIGWTFSDDDAVELEIKPNDHRRFLSDFYSNRFTGSFARGLPFQDNPVTGDCRISGTTASLTGIEKGLENKDEAEIDIAIRRILLLHGIILIIGGIPQIYLGDEISMLNDYAFANIPEKEGDSRWAHRTNFDWAKAEKRMDPKTVEGRIYQGLLHLIQIRQRNPFLTWAETEIIDTGNEHIFGFFRHHEAHRMIVLANFADYEVKLAANRMKYAGISKTMTDLVTGRIIDTNHNIVMEPCHLMVLIGAE